MVSLLSLALPGWSSSRLCPPRPPKPAPTRQAGLRTRYTTDAPLGRETRARYHEAVAGKVRAQQAVKQCQACHHTCS